MGSFRISRSEAPGHADPMIPRGLMLLVLAMAWLGSAHAVDQGAALMKTDLLGVFAHPDDETGAAGTLATYALGHGLRVANVYCTRGEGGGNMVGTQAGAALGVLREQELRQCLGVLGVQQCYFLDRTDFAYTESLSVTLETWGHEETLGRLVRLVRALRPEVIVTMNPAPNPGQHGNHQAAGVLAIEAFEAAADPGRFPEQLHAEGLSVWRPRKLYYGGPAGTGAVVDLTVPLPNGRTAADIAGEALAHHRSQGFGSFANSPWLRRPQHWTLVQSVVPFATDETDLRRGLPVDGDTPARIPSDPSDGSDLADGIVFQPRPAVAWYEQWTRARGIASLSSRFAPDLPVAAGEANVLTFSLPPSGDAAERIRVTFNVPEGWRVEPPHVDLPAKRRAGDRWQVRVVPPAMASEDVEIRAVGASQGREIRGSARLHPVPTLRIPRIRRPPPITGDEDARWDTIPNHRISETQTWQGTVNGASDLSGTFRVAHDGRFLYVEVRVQDDQVVSNIESNDIRGHWRSDSVELCLDPAGGAEHTLNAFKLGVFPFDRTGRVRAARDADARPGLVEETSPGTQLASWRTADGYAIRASIPLSDAGIPRRVSGHRLAFNVLLYDGDKADAAPGENINRSRLAWSPRPGVQGRPEDWGRAVLE